MDLSSNLQPQTQPSKTPLWLALTIISSLFTLCLGILVGLLAPNFLSYIKPPTSATIEVTPSPSPELDWTTYTDTTYNFQFQYPISYNPQDTGGGARTVDNNIVTTSLETITGDSIRVLLDTSTFSVDYLKKYAPTGSEFINPEAKTFGQNTFYYYGPGGGSVCYPDQYFFDLRGKILIFRFGECEFGKTPSKAIKAIERQVLTSFKIISTY